MKPSRLDQETVELYEALLRNRFSGAIIVFIVLVAGLAAAAFSFGVHI